MQCPCLVEKTTTDCAGGGICLSQPNETVILSDGCLFIPGP